MTIASDLPQLKKAMRAHQVAVRREACLAAGEAAAEAVAALAPLLGLDGVLVGGYWPMGDELDPRPLMGRLAQLGCRLALPVVTAPGQKLDFRAFSKGDALEAGRHGTWHPLASAPAVVPQAVLVPLLAFDRECFRLGYGGGYYDRTLESLRKSAQVRAIGLAFAAQEVAAVPRDGHDQRLDAIATQSELITPRAA
ncbi:MAG TPA: 5-formyltetrahydrofolate cyclo-ligase [Magnetospirillum sp.]|jgi:5-formyltetrahydrofolate cyclo-ligase|nr:5-formyltetrahydrofolate cyclo-ligase [Magnetospirillum sp.]